MKRGAPMARTPFQRKNHTENKLQKVAQSVTDKVEAAIISVVKMPAKTATFSNEFKGGFPKSAPVRNEAYRRLVASLPCIACGIHGYSQAAHLPPDGKGIKQGDDLIFPLCCVRVGVPGCHQDFDHYRMFPKAAAMTVGRAWAADTQRKIRAMGKWPKGLAYPHDQQQGTACRTI